MSSAIRWPIVRLSELAANVKNATVGGPFGSNLVSADYVESGVPVVRGVNLPFDRQFSLDSLAYVTEQKADSLSPNLAKPGDLVFTQRGTLGQVGIIPHNSAYERFLISQSQMKMTVDKEKANPLYLYYYFRLKSTFDYIENHALQSGVPHINLGILRKLEVVAPPIEVQNKIAVILSAYDDLIENNKRRIALLEKMAEEIYREWFVRFRFPGYQTAEFEKGIPKGWGMVKLEKAFQFLGGGTPSKENEAYWKDGNINWFTPSDITGASGIFLSGSGDQPNEEGLNNCSAKLFPAYSIMMTSRATIGEIGINRTEACTNQGFITCIPNKQYPLHYLYFWLKLSRNYFISLCGGATFPEINKSTFKRIEILTPSESIVKKFSCVAGPVFEQIETLLQENENLNKTKNLLLPRLISGKLSLENLDIQFPPSMQELG